MSSIVLKSSSLSPAIIVGDSKGDSSSMRVLTLSAVATRKLLTHGFYTSKEAARVRDAHRDEVRTLAHGPCMSHVRRAQFDKYRTFCAKGADP